MCIKRRADLRQDYIMCFVCARRGRDVLRCVHDPAQRHTRQCRLQVLGQGPHRQFPPGGIQVSGASRFIL